MLNADLKLNPKIFDPDVEQEPIRKGFGEGLLAAAEKNKNIVGLCADLTESTQMHFFAKKFPERFVQVGVAEQNLAAVASGMAAMGKIPFISSYAMFSPGRNWEQIRTTICYNDRKVVIAGSHSGVSVGPDGGTHQAIEDIAITRVIPNITVISPCDSIQAKIATEAAVKIKGPVYLRLAREKTPIMTTEETLFEVGKAQVLFSPPMNAEAVIVATGALVHKAIIAAQNFASRGVAVKVLNIHTIKPIDNESLVNAAKESGAIVTVEEHQVAGGLGSAVAEVLSENFPVPIEFVGIRDKFGQSGKPEELIEHYCMGVSHIENALNKVLSRKK